MSSIRETVVEAIPSEVTRDYGNYVDWVVRDLEAREENALAVIDRLGQALGASEEDINDILVAAGLREPTPEPSFSTETADYSDLMERLNTVIEQNEATRAEVRAVAERVERAAQAAARAGVTF